MYNAITDVPGIKVGHYTDKRAATGCTVVLCQEGAQAGVDIRGSAPGTRETDLLNPLHLVEEAHAILISGGSSFGLNAAGGVMRYLEEQSCGLDVGVARVPIVPAAILFDLSIGNAKVRPGVDEGYAACLAADSGIVAEGTVGAGTGARVGKALGNERAVKSGIGTTSKKFGKGIIVGALVAANALGDVIDPDTGQTIAGPRRPDGKGFLKSSDIFISGEAVRPFVPTNTTIVVVATNAPLNKTQATKIAQMAHDGLARVIRPAHTMFDGDVVFVLSVGKNGGKQLDVTTLGTVATDIVAQAIIRAVTQAEGLHGIPSATEVLRC